MIGADSLLSKTTGSLSERVARSIELGLAVSLCLFLAGCGAKANAPNSSLTARDCAIAIASHEGTSRIDKEIIRQQQAARESRYPLGALERLGWLFVEKARQSYDPGFYRIAESCAACMEAQQNGNAGGMLIRGHVLDSLHRFKEAESIGRVLVARRGLHLDYGLLGDSLMEQGRLDEAVYAYQRMIDLKPGPYSYARVAHIRWLKGDVEGAIEMMSMAARATGPGEGESAAWNYTRLALYELQAGARRSALAAVNAALQIKGEYAPALLARGRILLSQGKNADACGDLSRAAAENPLPEYQWVFSEALRTAGRIEEAHAVEAELESRGAVSDPRTFSIYLATKREKPELAVSLAREEQKTRLDVFTLDSLAWALTSAGKAEEARKFSERALLEGTKDARLFYHAGVIAKANGNREDARRWLRQALKIRQMLLPSEKEGLLRAIAES
jgi:tetratricopeptide (TPR) repeat protein